MDENNEWYEVIKQKEHLIVIRERLDELDPRFYTHYVNMYLINGFDKALLIDTGCGLYPLKPLIIEIIDKKELIVVNSHSHFDHRGSNHEFSKVFIHKREEKGLKVPMDISFLKDSPKKIVKRYKSNGYKLKPAQMVESLKDNHEFDLGGVQVKTYHTPGHSEGCISLTTNTGELFTGDTAHYGTMFLPKKKNLPTLLNTLSNLINIAKNNNIFELYPSHEQFPVGIELLEKLIAGISNIETIWHKRVKDKFLHAWILEDQSFKYII